MQDQLCNKVRRVHIVSLVADTIIVTLQLFTVHSSQFTVFPVVHTFSQVVHTIVNNCESQTLSQASCEEGSSINIKEKMRGVKERVPYFG